MSVRRRPKGPGGGQFASEERPVDPAITPLRIHDERETDIAETAIDCKEQFVAIHRSLHIRMWRKVETERELAQSSSWKLRLVNWKERRQSKRNLREESRTIQSLDNKLGAVQKRITELLLENPSLEAQFFGPVRNHGNYPDLLLSHSLHARVSQIAASELADAIEDNRDTWAQARQIATRRLLTDTGSALHGDIRGYTEVELQQIPGDTTRYWLD